MGTGVVIFSRMDSRRLPGKALLDIGGRCLLGRVIDRAKFIQGAERVILATSLRDVDDPIYNFGIAEGINVFRGSIDDVGGRALGVCKQFGLKKFARICGDRPFFSPELVSQLIEIHDKNDFDIVTTMFPRTYPPGLTTEIISTDALDRALAKTNDLADREHLTNHFYREFRDYKIHNVAVSERLNVDGVSLVVDNDSDLARARWIASRIKTTSNDMRKIIQLAQGWNVTHKNLKGSK